jgi:hypothetical protein
LVDLERIVVLDDTDLQLIGIRRRPPVDARGLAPADGPCPAVLTGDPFGIQIGYLGCAYTPRRPRQGCPLASLCLCSVALRRGQRVGLIRRATTALGRTAWQALLTNGTQVPAAHAFAGTAGGQLWRTRNLGGAGIDHYTRTRPKKSRH